MSLLAKAIDFVMRQWSRVFNSPSQSKKIQDIDKVLFELRCRIDKLEEIVTTQQGASHSLWGEPLDHQVSEVNRNTGEDEAAERKSQAMIQLQHDDLSCPLDTMEREDLDESELQQELPHGIEESVHENAELRRERPGQDESDKRNQLTPHLQDGQPPQGRDLMQRRSDEGSAGMQQETSPAKQMSHARSIPKPIVWRKCPKCQHDVDFKYGECPKCSYSVNKPVIKDRKKRKRKRTKPDSFGNPDNSKA